MDFPFQSNKYEKYKAGDANGEVPNVPFQMLTALNLDTKEWTEIARKQGTLNAEHWVSEIEKVEL